MTDPASPASSSPSPTRTSATTGSARRRWSPSASTRAAAIMREAVNSEDAPSAERGWLDWLADCGIPAITGVDTRALVRHIRDAGAMRGGLFPAATPRREARELIAAEPSMAGRDLAREVTPPSAIDLEPTAAPGRPARSRRSTPASRARSSANLRARGARVELHPCTVSADELLAERPRRVLPGQRPGRPGGAGLHRRHRARAGRASGRCSGICLGHQLLCRAVGPGDVQAALRPPRRQPPGQGPAAGHDRDHLPEPRLRGAGPGRRSAPSTPASRALGDRLRRRRADPRQPLRPHGRGPRLLDVPGGTVQYHPEAGPGPARRLYLFDRFLRRSRAVMPRRDDIQQDPDPRLGADRHRPGRRVRLLGRAGLQGPARGGLRGRPRQLQPGHDHDRPGVRRRDLRRAAAARAGGRR